MLERNLSTRGKILLFTCFAIIFGICVILEFMGQGPISWVDQFQAQNIFDGKYYPKLSFLLVGLVIAIPCFGLGYGHDYIFRMGMFEPKES